MEENGRAYPEPSFSFSGQPFRKLLGRHGIKQRLNPFAFMRGCRAGARSHRKTASIRHNHDFHPLAGRCISIPSPPLLALEKVSSAKHSYRLYPPRSSTHRPPFGPRTGSGICLHSRSTGQSVREPVQTLPVFSRFGKTDFCRRAGCRTIRACKILFWIPMFSSTIQQPFITLKRVM